MTSTPDFVHSQHTLIVSDIHLADAEEPHPKYPHWKRFKRPEHFTDHTFKKFLESMSAQINDPIELILNGDIFDFDSVMIVPSDPQMHLNWLERLRGLSSEESKSRFKMRAILDSHTVWIQALKEFLQRGNRIVFIIGNHDMELHWPTVRQDLIDRLISGPEQKGFVRFCEWFYLSNQDTLVEHGNQYDAYCLCYNPVHPLIKRGSRILVRLPFGNLAGKFMVNGMGLMNPHATNSYIKSSVWGYIQFYYKFVMKTQPFLIWTWFWTAFVTLVESMREGLLPALSDPFTVDVRMEDIAKRANATVGMVLALKEVHVHPAIFNPIKILRELWLDRAILLLLILLVSFQFFSFLNVFSQVSFFWFIFPMIFLMPAYIYYASSVQSEVNTTQMAAFHMAPLSARITKVKRIVQGHTHLERHTEVEGIEVLNTGTWSPAYHDVECTQPYGRKCFAWIKPRDHAPLRIVEKNTVESDGPKESGATAVIQFSDRTAELYEWDGERPVFINRS